MNKAILMGRLTAEPELRQTASGINFCTFRIAVNRPYQKGKENVTDFLPIVTWRGTAEFVSKYFHKGDPIQVEGRIETRSYDDKDGRKVFVTEIAADNVAFVEGAGRNSNSGANTNEFAGFTDVDDNEDDLPF